MAISHDIVSVDPKMLNPVLWRTLPKDLLLLVFARLPLPDIARLRCLSREWRKDMATANSEINQACHEVSSARVALLARGHGGFVVTIYDVKTRKCQYAYRLHLRGPWNGDYNKTMPFEWTTVDSRDGGLVCFISVWKANKRKRLCIVVVNLLTRVQHELPRSRYLYFTLPPMVQIKVDSHTKCYQVVVVADNTDYGFTTGIYDSSTKQWTGSTSSPSCDSILGTIYKWFNLNVWFYRSSDIHLGVYDFTQGKLEFDTEDNPSTSESVIASVLEKDRIFVLQEQTQMDAFHQRRAHHGCCITEHHFENQTQAWVQVKSYECLFLKELPMDELYALSIIACDGFLMVQHNWENKDWLLDLSTNEWRNLPEASKNDICFFFMSKVFWNVVP